MKGFLTATLVTVAALALAGAGAARTTDGVSKRYVVAFTQSSGLPANVDELVASAGGTVTARLDAIGGVVATSVDPGFASALAAAAGVSSVAEDVQLQLVPDFDATGAGSDAAAEEPGAVPQPGTEPLFWLQWDKMRMNVSSTGSYAVQRGRRDVVVADLDSGVDATHPDIAANLDLARSRSFVATEPDLTDRSGHGTWTASTIAAPINSFGMSGVAPNVTLLALKVLDGAGRGSFASVADALVYAADNHVDVASMSFGAYFDRNENKADVKLVRRALQYARSHGVTLVAALGNDNRDLADPALGNVIELPGDAPGVIGVSATGYSNAKAFYSTYGLGSVDVAAPGGASLFQPVPAPLKGGGRLLGAWSGNAVALSRVPPPFRFQSCSAGACAWYVWMQGTSMAAPNVAGVAALIVSQSDKKKGPSPGSVEAQLSSTANNQPCPANPFNPVPWTAVCAGDTGDNGFYGKGIVDALKAVTTK